MRTKPIVAGAVVMALLLLVGIVFIAARPSPPAFTVRHVKSLQSGDLVTVTFEITNHVSNRCFVHPDSVEVRNGLIWKKCFDLSRHQGTFVVPHGSESFTFDMTNLPAGSPLRLRMYAGRGLMRIEGFFRRLSLRFRHGNKDVPLSPFDKETVYAKPTWVVSDEFIEPEPNPVVKGASDK